MLQSCQILATNLEEALESGSAAMFHGKLAAWQRQSGSKLIFVTKLFKGELTTEPAAQ